MTDFFARLTLAEGIAGAEFFLRFATFFDTVFFDLGRFTLLDNGFLARDFLAWVFWVTRFLAPDFLAAAND